jgi:hypothetical protein
LGSEEKVQDGKNGSTIGVAAAVGITFKIEEIIVFG